MLITREYELTTPVTEWLTARGNEVYTEVPFLGRCVDMIGRHDQRITVVELKMGFCVKVIYQLVHMDIVADELYLAVARKPKPKTLDEVGRTGAGVLWVHDGAVIKLSESCCHKPWEPQQKILHGRLDRMETGGIAGMPNIKGHGPALECAAAVTDYRQEHPCASWDELFKNVPNHYCSARSMAGALRVKLEMASGE